MIKITDRISLSESELEWNFVRSSGPGGQNVNKVATAVELRVDIENAPGLGDEVKERLRRVAGRRINAAGTLTIQARRFRSQMMNREDALRRLIDMLTAAAHVPAMRKKTVTSAAERRRRLREKRARAEIKSRRARVQEVE